MQTFTPLQLTETQKQVLTAYGNTCRQKLDFKGDQVTALDFLKGLGLVDKYQDHISDLGAAYLMTQCGFSFNHLLKVHNWQDRLSTRILVGKSISTSKEAEQLYHVERYKLLLKYNCFDYGMPPPKAQKNSESTPSNMAQMITELMLNLVDNDLFNWKDLQRFLVGQDPYNDQDLRKINSKESFKEYCKTAQRRLGAN